jgi:hypothetical protein
MLSAFQRQVAEPIAGLPEAQGFRLTTPYTGSWLDSWR